MTLPAWWARPGSPGWSSDAAFAPGQPWTFAGLVAGGFALRDPLAPTTLPMPGIAEAQAPLAWYDSAAVVLGENAAWRGFAAALATGELTIAPPAGRKPRSVWTAVSGSTAIDRNGIFVSRADERSWLRGGAVAGRRGGIGDLDLAGDHLWTFGAGTRRGAHTLDGAFAQRGVGERQRAGFGEAARGESGWARWAWSDSLRDLSLRLSRGHDARESFGIGGIVLERSRRDGQANVAELEGTSRRGGREWGVRMEVRQDFVVRVLGNGEARDAWRARSAWTAARHARPLGPGRLELQLGGGRTDGAERESERMQLAPGASWRLGSGERALRVYAERIVSPVWNDLAPGTPAFVQDTWVGGADARVGLGSGRAGLQVLGGTTGNRAVLLRYPVRDVSFRIERGLGWERDASRYTFALGLAEAGARWRALGAEASGYVLARDGDVLQGRVDPWAGATGALTAGFRLFAGDLGVRLRGEAAWIGSRRTDTRAFDEFGAVLFEDRTLPGYSTLSASAELTLGDAVMVLRGDGLEGVRHEQGWLDPSNRTGYVLARDKGQSFRFEMVWPLFN